MLKRCYYTAGVVLRRASQLKANRCTNVRNGVAISATNSLPPTAPCSITRAPTSQLPRDVLAARPCFIVPPLSLDAHELVHTTLLLQPSRRTRNTQILCVYHISHYSISRGRLKVSGACLAHLTPSTFSYHGHVMFLPMTVCHVIGSTKLELYFQVFCFAVLTLIFSVIINIASLAKAFNNK